MFRQSCQIAENLAAVERLLGAEVSPGYTGVRAGSWVPGALAHAAQEVDAGSAWMASMFGATIAAGVVESIRGLPEVGLADLWDS